MKTKTLILALAFGLITLFSCKDENPTEPDLYKNGDGYYYAEVVSGKPGCYCNESCITIPDTNGLKEILLNEFKPYAESYPHFFIAVNLPDSLAFRGTKIRLKIRALTNYELDTVYVRCGDTVEPLPSMLMVTETIRLKDK